MTAMQHDDAWRLRVAESGDGPTLCRLVQQIDRESDFMLREPGESPHWLEDPATGPAALEAQGHRLIVAEAADDSLVGYLLALRGAWASSRLVATLALGVLGTHQHRGIGRSLLAAVEQWATANGVHRLELTVHPDNVRARDLYRRFGFAEEGRLRAALLIGNRRSDEVLMGKLVIDAPPERPPLLLPMSMPRRQIGVMAVRPLRAEDADQYVAFNTAVRGENPFVLRKAEETYPSAAAVRVLLDQAKDERTMLWQVAEADGQLVGDIQACRGRYQRARGDAQITLNILRSHWGIGIGDHLLHAAVSWAIRARCHRLSVRVLSHDVRGRAFYRKHGFGEEAAARCFMLDDYGAIDLIHMARLLPTAVG